MKIIAGKSKKGLKQFIAYLEKNSEVTKRLQQSLDNYKGDKTKMTEVISNTIVPIAESEGYVFSAEKYITYLQNEVENRLANTAITDDDLSTVTGGVGDVEMSGDTEGSVIIEDNHTEYHQTEITINLFITPETSPDTLRAIAQALNGR